MRGHIAKRKRQTKDGKPYQAYYVVYDLPMEWDEARGAYRRRQKWEKVDPPETLKHAEKVLAERLAQIHRGEFVEPNKVTFAEFKPRWIENYAKGQVRPSTLAFYLGLCRHLLPVFGDLPLAQVTVEKVQAFQTAKPAEGLAPQTVKHLLALLRQMLNHAVDWGLIRHNPARKVKPPRIPKREMDFLSPAEVRLFLEHVPARWYALILTAITSGLRQGELLAMRWANLEVANGRYSVKECLVPARETEESGFRAPKTESSVQPVDLSPACLAALLAHRKRQAEERLQAGPSWQEHDLVFCTATGGPLNGRNVVQRVFEPALRAAGLRHIRFHDMRHTCASLLIAQGECIKYVQRQLRHASAQITLNTYAHLLPETGQAAARRMDDTLFGITAEAADPLSRADGGSAVGVG
jgi:integrase